MKRGDKVLIDGMTATPRSADVDAGEYSTGYPAADWGRRAQDRHPSLTPVEIGFVHYPDASKGVPTSN